MQNQHKSKRRTTIIIVSIIGILLVAAAATGYYFYDRMKSANSYADCVSAGNPIMESSPEQCRTPDGKLFTNPEASKVLEGLAVCLPHKASNGGPQTLECAIGLKTDDGTYYGVSGDKDNELGSIAGSNRKVRISGTVEKSTDTVYNITELISVKKIEILN